MLNTLANDLLIILAAGLLAGLLCRSLRISVLVGYLLVGVFIGKACLGWVVDEGHAIEYIAEAGVFLLLFSIGLEFSLEELWHLRRHLLVGGSLQMLLVAAPVALLLLVIGRPWQPAVLMAAAAAFSSTILVFKALSEWGHTSLPHGRRAIGILLFQDAALIPLLLVVPLMTGTGQAAGPAQYAMLLLTSVLFVLAVVVLRHILGKWVVSWFANYRSPELVVLFTLVSLGSVTAAAHAVGLPAAIGAFAAGLIFNGNRWTKQIDALVLPFRETFAAIFFVSLGLLFDPRLLRHEPLIMLICLAGLIALKALAACCALRLTRLPWQSSIGVGIGLAHIGEFAFVLLLLGWKSGVIAETDYQRLMTLAIGSLILSPMLLRAGLRWTRSATETHELESTLERIAPGNSEAIVVGAGPIGRHVASQLETIGRDVCLIDLSPINLHSFAQNGFRTTAGDATDLATLKLARVDAASLAVVSVPNDEVAVHIVRNIRELNPTCLIVVRCRYQTNASRLRKAGANQVVSEETEASKEVLRVLAELE